MAHQPTPWRPTVYKTEADARNASIEDLRQRKSELIRRFCTEQIIVDRELSRRASKQLRYEIVTGLSERYD